MFVSSPHEFPENCVYNHNGLNVLLNICTENYLLQIFSLMILKLLKKKKKSAFIGFAYQNNDFFVLFINYVFNSSQK
jgi:hypothetical protein